MGVTAGEEVQYRMRVWLADPNDPRRQVYERVASKQSSSTEADATRQPSGEATGNGRAAGIGQRGGERAGATSQPGSAAEGNPYDLTFLDVAPKVRKRLQEREKQPEPENKELAFLKHALPSEWCEPTEWIQIPRANAEVVIGQVDTGLPQTVNDVTYYSQEPEVDVVIKKWDPALQVQVPVAKSVRRGSVMNFRSEAKVINPIDQQIYPINRELIEGETGGEGVHFSTNAFVVDIFGGRKMPFSTLDKTYFEPSEILVMREDGKLVVRNELDDSTEYRHGIYADDEYLTDNAPVVKEGEKPAGISRGSGR
jgi:hypothetical protein